VPDVTSVENGCDDESLALIPFNATRRNDFPPDDYPFIALAPWTDEACVQSYLSLMRMEAVRGAIFYLNDSATSRPPPVSEPAWSLRDGGRWKSQNQFPIYALPGSVGASLMSDLARYSGNMSTAPFGDQLTQIYDPADSVRLFTRIQISNNPGIPSLWVFLIIVLAILLAIVLLTSVVMHMIQRRQRTLLSRRVARGEVDLEALGIKRLNVPQELLDNMPQYVYTSKTEGATVTLGKAAPRGVSFSQPACPICLDDYIHGETTIRELPCNHIFHPKCIDPFLRDSSSLCPVCKKSALPAGYCPVSVTNLMVRRERLIRRMGQRNDGAAPTSRIPAVAALQRRVRTLSMANPPSSYNHNSRLHGHGAFNGDAEMINVIGTSDRRSTLPTQPAAVHTDGTAPVQPLSHGAIVAEVPAEIAAQGTHARRAWLRERVARRQQQQYDEQAQTARQVDEGRPLCKFHVQPLESDALTRRQGEE
jgi:Ring finger domain